MTTVNPVVTGGAGRRLKFVWSNVATGDTVTEQELPVGGFYNLAITGTFAGGTVAKFLAGLSTGPTKSIPTDASGTEFSTTSATSTFVIGPIAGGTFVKPSVSSGSSDSVTFTLSEVMYG